MAMSEDARASVLDLGLDAMAERLVALYRRLLAGGAEPAGPPQGRTPSA
jgi:hypothetical protein